MLFYTGNCPFASIHSLNANKLKYLFFGFRIFDLFIVIIKFPSFFENNFIIKNRVYSTNMFELLPCYNWICCMIRSPFSLTYIYKIMFLIKFKLLRLMHYLVNPCLLYQFCQLYLREIHSQLGTHQDDFDDLLHS